MSTPTIRRLKIIECIKEEPRTVKSIKKLLRSEFHDNVENSDKIENIELALNGDLKQLLANGQIIKYKSNGKNKTSDYSENLFNDDEMISLADHSLSVKGTELLEKQGCTALIPLVSEINESIKFSPIYEFHDEKMKVLQIRVSSNNWIKTTVDHQHLPINFIILRKPEPIEKRLNLKTNVDRFGKNLCLIQVPNKCVSGKAKNGFGHVRIQINEDNTVEIEDLNSTNHTHYQELSDMIVADLEKYFQTFDQKENQPMLNRIIEPEILKDKIKILHKASAMAKTPIMIHVPGIDPLTLILK